MKKMHRWLPLLFVGSLLIACAGDSEETRGYRWLEPPAYVPSTPVPTPPTVAPSIYHRLIPKPTEGDLAFTRATVVGDSLFVMDAFNDAGEDQSDLATFDLWTGEHTGNIAPPEPEFFFGLCFEALGNQLVVCSPEADGGLGLVHVFDLATRELVRTIPNPGSTTHTFGAGIALSEDYLLVAAGYDLGNNNGGAVYAFDAATGAVISELVNPEPFQQDQFGATMAIQGDIAFVGSRHTNGVHVYDIPSGTLLFDIAHPSPCTACTPPADALGEFGTVLRATADTLIVSAPLDSTQVYRGGAVFVFDWTPAGAVLRYSLENPIPDGGRYGLRLATTSGRLVIGASRSGPDSYGVIYTHELDTGASIDEIQPPPDHAGPGSFVNWLDASGDRVIASAHLRVMIIGPENTAPWAMPQTVRLPGSARSQEVSLFAVDPDGDPHTFEVIQAPQFGTLSGSPPHLIYKPLKTFSGVDEFTYRAYDAWEASNEAVVKLVVP